jgi:hypothetical protein
MPLQAERGAPQNSPLVSEKSGLLPARATDSVWSVLKRQRCRWSLGSAALEFALPSSGCEPEGFLLWLLSVVPALATGEFRWLGQRNTTQN